MTPPRIPLGYEAQRERLKRVSGDAWRGMAIVITGLVVTLIYVEFVAWLGDAIGPHPVPIECITDSQCEGIEP